jgi:hypothetical protein
LSATALGMNCDIFSWRLIEILAEEKRYGRSGRFMNLLDVPIGDDGKRPVPDEGCRAAGRLVLLLKQDVVRVTQHEPAVRRSKTAGLVHSGQE